MNMSLPLWAWIVAGLLVVCIIGGVIRYLKNHDVVVLRHYVDLYVIVASNVETTEGEENTEVHRGVIELSWSPSGKNVRHRILHQPQLDNATTYSILPAGLSVRCVTRVNDRIGTHGEFGRAFSSYCQLYSKATTKAMKRLTITEMKEGIHRKRIVYGEYYFYNLEWKYYVYSPSQQKLMMIKQGDTTDDGFIVNSMTTDNWVPWRPDETEHMMVWRPFSTERMKLTGLSTGELIINGKEVTKGFNKVYSVKYSDNAVAPKYLYTVFPYLIEIVEEG
jgi:hypothetical protein